MPKFTQKYTIIQLLEPMKEGTVYEWTDWPLHVTIADVFAVDLEGTHFIEKLERLLATETPFTVTAGKDDYFGPERQTRVKLLNMNDELIHLHYDVVRLLKENGAVFNVPEFVEAGFKPHSTVQKNSHLNEGDTVKFDALTLIDMFPGEDPYKRRVMKTIPLGRVQ